MTLPVMGSHGTRAAVLGLLLGTVLSGALLGEEPRPVTTWTVDLEGSEPIKTHETLAVCVQADGGKLVVVSADRGPWVVRFDARGSVVSSVPLPTFAYPALAGACDPLGRVFIARTGARVDAFDGLTGTHLWESRAGELYEASARSYSLSVDVTGDPILAASVRTRADDLLLVVLRFDRSTGGIVWGPVAVPSVEGSFAHPLVRTGGEGVVVGASRYLASCYFSSGSCEPDAVMARLDRSTGDVLWEKHVSGSGGIRDLRIGPRSRIAIATRTSYGLGSLDVLRLGDGSLLWSRPIPASPSYSRFASPAFDPSGHVVLATDTLVTKLDGSTGRTAWGPRLLNGVSDLEMDGAGSPIVLIVSDGGSGGRVEKLEPGSGRTVWSSPLEVPVPDYPQYSPREALVVTPEGDAFVTAGGYSGTLAGQQHDGRDGHPLEPVSRALDRGFRIPASLTLLNAPGASGDVLVEVPSSTSHPQRALIRLERSSGRELWRVSVLGASRVAASGDVYSLGLDTSSGVYRVTRLDSLTGAEVFRVSASSSNVRLELGLPADGTLRVGRLGPSTDEIDILSAADGSHLGHRVLTGRQISGFEPLSGDVIARSGVAAIRVDPRSGASRWSRALSISLDFLEASFTPQGHALLSNGHQALLLDGVDGHVLWGPVSVEGPDSSCHSSIPKLVDSEGGILMTACGTSGQSSGFGLMRLDPATGEVLWGPRWHSGTGPSFSHIYSINPGTQTSALVRASRCDATLWGVPCEREVAAVRLSDGEPMWAVGGPAFIDATAIDGRGLLTATLASGRVKVSSFDPFTLGVSDATGARSTTKLRLALRAGGWVAIASERLPSGSHRLTAPGEETAVAWLPGGETTRSITVSPRNASPYGVTVTTADGCASEGWAFVGTERPDVSGDLDADGDVDVFDLVILAGALVGNVTPGGSPYVASHESADLDADGDVDLFDLVLLASRITGT